MVTQVLPDPVSPSKVQVSVVPPAVGSVCTYLSFMLGRVGVGPFCSPCRIMDLALLLAPEGSENTAPESELDLGAASVNGMGASETEMERG